MSFLFQYIPLPLSCRFDAQLCAEYVTRRPSVTGLKTPIQCQTAYLKCDLVRIFLDFTSLPAENMLFIAQDAKKPAPTLYTMPLLLLPLSGDRHAPKNAPRLPSHQAYLFRFSAPLNHAHHPTTRAFHASISRTKKKKKKICGCKVVSYASFNAIACVTR